MANVLDPVTDIHNGIWTDWSKGQTWGLTWSLPPTPATILTNSLTLFVAFSGIQLWAIVRYCLHQLHSSAAVKVRTPHLNKEQIILRNAGSDLATGWLMLNLGWSSRHSNGRLSWRSYSIGLAAMSYAVLIMAAGIFSNRIVAVDTVNGGAPVLARSKYCGVWNQTYLALVEGGSFLTADELELYVQSVAKRAHDVQLSSQYAQACYLPTPNTGTAYIPSTCNMLKVPSLTWSTLQGSCPFKSQLCHGDSDVVVIDTGDIDSHDHLGINSDPKERLRYRRVTTCAVLNDTGRITGGDGTNGNESEITPSTQTVFARFGRSLYKNTPWTYSYTNLTSLFNNFTAQVTSPYQLDVERAYAAAEPAWSVSDFEPDDDVAQAVADLTLLFLSFSGTYTGQVDDPWFSAHDQRQFDTALQFLQTRYARRSLVSTLGCTEQHMFCTSNGTCTGLLGFDQVQNINEFNAALTPHQNATFDRMLRAVSVSCMASVVENLVANNIPLISSNATLSGASGAVISKVLPNDQWKRELSYWHSISMAHMQRTISQWATGQVALTFNHDETSQFLNAPSEEQDLWFCDNFMLASKIYQSFSVMTLVLIGACGILLIICGIYVESVAHLFRQCFRRTQDRDDWECDDMLLLGYSVDEEKPQPPPKDILQDFMSDEFKQSNSSASEKHSSIQHRRTMSSLIFRQDISFGTQNKAPASRGRPAKFSKTDQEHHPVTTPIPSKGSTTNDQKIHSQHNLWLGARTEQRISRLDPGVSWI